MAFVTQRGVSSLDPFLSTGRIILTHPDSPHSLVLVGVQDESGYAPAIDGWHSSDGRSISGGLRTRGVYRNPVEELDVAFLCSQKQIQLFDWLKRLQDNTNTPITCQDWIQKISQAPGQPAPAWLPGWPVTNDLGLPEGYQSFVCWIDTDRGYKTPNVGTAWWLLQFQILREV